QRIEAELGAGVLMAERERAEDHERNCSDPYTSPENSVPAALHGQPCPVASLGRDWAAFPCPANAIPAIHAVRSNRPWFKPIGRIPEHPLQLGGAGEGAVH